CGRACAEAAADSWKRLLAPSLENETFSTLFEAASEQAIKVFGENLHHLLMQPPVKGHVVLGLDPAYRTGCKIAVVDDTGKVLDTTVIYPTPPQSRIPEAKATLKKLIAKHNVSVISIGNGTASRESEQFVAELIPELDRPVSYVIVSEAGASVYSASKLASEEFPEYDVSLRSAASIARRLQDPLAELVKIDPKAIGIGQYQHDMPKARLDSTLGGVVEQCVNSVGVDLNTASPSLLSHIAGINSGIAKNVVSYREENGGFRSRAELLKVPKLGKKAYEQCAGFLRLSGSSNPLDGTAVHPESYKAAKALLEKCGFKLTDIGSEKLADLPNRLEQQGLSALAEQLDIGVPTIRDIAAELVKPGRDPRDSMPPPLLRTDVMEMKDLKPDMILTGTVRNVIDFGAFVDIGVHEDGLVHISQLSDRFIKHPSQAVKVGDIVKVKVLEVDLRRKRISLTMKGLQ
ncbi:MAG: helix-hairpin-helix domain-containing protein, partial [Angelakisella sp.]